MEEKPERGQFIVFEGLDGSGQSTQAALLAERLKKAGRKVHLTKEPTNNMIGGLIRAALTGEWKASNRIIQMLYAADRQHHLDREIIPALDKGFTVITDRYFYSSMAYGSIDLDMKWVETLNKDCLLPDLAFYISVAPKTSVKRIHAGRFEIELFEKEKQLEIIAESYAKIVKKHKLFQVIDGERTVEEIHEDIFSRCLP